MDLGAFSISLNVKDIEQSLKFYEDLGFKVIDGGDTNKDFPDTDDQKWRILTNEIANIGLFQGMFEENMLSFNPKDAAQILKTLEKNNHKIIARPEEGSEFKTVIAEDPDGNKLMFDQID